MASKKSTDIVKNQDIFTQINAMLVVTSDNVESKTQVLQQRDELESLCATLGINCTAWNYFNIRVFNSATYLGSGQVQRLAYYAEENQCNLIVFNNSISPRIQRNLEQALGIAVVDRQEIILQIFANRAITKEAKLQVELAQLTYSLPRLKRAWCKLSQQRGGVKGAKGSGEKQLELDKRQAQNRIVQLKKEIAEIEKQRNVQRRNRTVKDMCNIAIVGYTNSGKSTLLNRISNANVLSEDKLFATLDTTTRKVFLPSGKITLFTDTVGFVSNLPHELVDAFKSTLEEASLADILLIVLDASREDFIMCWETTKKVLEDLNAFDKKRLVILNKMDLVTQEMLFALNSFSLSGEKYLTMSVAKDKSIKNLLCEIENLIDDNKEGEDD